MAKRKRRRGATTKSKGGFHSRLSKEIDATIASEGVSSYVTDWVSTGYLSLDKILGGGIPVGRFTELFGNESSGKSTLAFSILAQAQKLGYQAVLIETECSLERVQLTRVGVNLDTLVLKSPDNLEETMDTIEDMVDMILKSKDAPKGTVLVWDSISATVSEKETNKGYNESRQYPIHASVMSLAMRRLGNKISKANVAIVFVNQVREKFNVTYGAKTTTFGGRALRFHASIRMSIRQITQIKRGKEGKPLGIMTEVYIAKSKVAAPFGKVKMPIMFDTGINSGEGYLLEGISVGIIVKRGGFYRIKGKDKSYRRDIMIKRLMKSEKLQRRIANA